MWFMCSEKNSMAALGGQIDTAILPRQTSAPSERFYEHKSYFWFGFSFLIEVDGI